MPIYEYSCCGNKWEGYNSVEKRDSEVCSVCGKRARLNISLPSHPVVYEFYSETVGEYITSPKQKQRVLREKNLAEI